MYREDPYTRAMIEAMGVTFQRQVVSKWWIHHRKHLACWYDIRDRFPRVCRAQRV